jgi:amidase
LEYREAGILAKQLRDGELSSSELLEHFVAQIEKCNPQVNAVVALRLEEARQEAKQADERRRSGEDLSPLHGLPMTVKESWRVVGMPITWGHPKMAGNVADQDAVAIRRLREAGAIIFGKTNVPYLLGDWQTYNEIYGTTNNPWDLGRSPGGSSGGAAAALAAGMTPLELGSDIGASLRNPAHYCGVFAHKPTWGVVSQSGHAPLGVVNETDLGVVGPLGRSARDLALSLDIIAGPNDIDAVGWRLALPKARFSTLNGRRFAMKADSKIAPVDNKIAAKMSDLADFLRKEGAVVEEIAWPEGVDEAEMHRFYIHLLRAAVSRNYSSAEMLAFREEVGPKPSRSDDYWTLTREGISIAHRDWLMIHELRHRMRLKWNEFLNDYDGIITPVAQNTAMLHDHSEPRHLRKIEVNGKPSASIDQLFWAGLATTFYLPATAFPLGLAEDGLPIGAQIVGAQYRDYETIAFAGMIERGFGGFVRPPGF